MLAFCCTILQPVAGRHLNVDTPILLPSCPCIPISTRQPAITREWSQIPSNHFPRTSSPLHTLSANKISKSQALQLPPSSLQDCNLKGNYKGEVVLFQIRTQLCVSPCFIVSLHTKPLALLSASCLPLGRAGREGPFRTAVLLKHFSSRIKNVARSHVGR